MTQRIWYAVGLLFVVAALMLSSGDATAQEQTPTPAPTPAHTTRAHPPTLEELCTVMVWERMAPYWELGDDALPFEPRETYRECLKPPFPPA